MASTSAGWNFEFWRQNHRPATQNVGWKLSLLFILIFFGLYKSAESGRSFYIIQAVSTGLTLVRFQISTKWCELLNIVFLIFFGLYKSAESGRSSYDLLYRLFVVGP